MESAPRPRVTRPEAQFIYLPEDVILEICSYLSHDDLYNLSFIDDRISRIVMDKSLWKRVFFEQPVSLQALHTFARQLFPSANVSVLQITGFLKKFAGKPRSARQNITAPVLRKIRETCPNLTRFILNGCTLDFSNVSLSKFPRNLRSLELTSCGMLRHPSRESWLKEVFVHLRQLVVVRIEECAWVDSHAIIPLSKLRNLKALSMRNCRGFGNTFAYMSLAARWGTWNLKYLDISGTGITSLCFATLMTPRLCQNLTHFYAEQCRRLNADGFARLPILRSLEVCSIADMNAGAAYTVLNLLIQSHPRYLNASGSSIPPALAESLRIRHSTVSLETSEDFIPAERPDLEKMFRL